MRLRIRFRQGPRHPHGLGQVQEERAGELGQRGGHQQRGQWNARREQRSYWGLRERG